MSTFGSKDLISDSVQISTTLGSSSDLNITFKSAARASTTSSPTNLSRRRLTKSTVGNDLQLLPNSNLYSLSDVAHEGPLRLWGPRDEKNYFPKQPAHPFQGALVDNRYRVNRYFANGSFCHCFTAWDSLHDRIICLKTFKPVHFYQSVTENAAWSDIAKGLLACRNQKRLQETKLKEMTEQRKYMVEVVHVTNDHEPVPILLKNGLSGYIHIICEEYCEYRSLMQFRRGRRLDPDNIETALYFIRQLLTAVTSLHKVGYAHLDIKEDNIMVSRGQDNNLCIKLGDFGFVKRLNPANEMWIPFMYGGKRWYFSPNYLEFRDEDPTIVKHDQMHTFVAPE